MYKGMNWSEINNKQWSEIFRASTLIILDLRVHVLYTYSTVRVHVRVYVCNVQRVTVRVLPYFRKYSNIHLRCVYPIGQIEKIYYSAVAVFGRSI
jgi:hypothetical protein